VPEGDTILRLARTLDEGLAGREISAARCVFSAVAARSLVGDTVTGVEARGKHLLIRLASGRVVHSHMRMTGTWRVYAAGQRWDRPAWRARMVLEAGDRVAVCFDAPVVELLASAREERAHPALAGLGPDIMVAPLDTAEVARRAALVDPATPVGDVLHDQRVVAGIGNIFRSEALWVGRVHPCRPIGSLDPAALAAVVEAAARLMRAPARRPHAVYRRAGRPCPRCGSRVASGPIGAGRVAYWCPRCQPAPAAEGGSPRFG
jgi:endonuclease-8